MASTRKRKTHRQAPRGAVRKTTEVVTNERCARQRDQVGWTPRNHHHTHPHAHAQVCRACTRCTLSSPPPTSWATAASRAARLAATSTPADALEIQWAGQSDPSAKTSGVRGCPWDRRYCASGTARWAMVLLSMFQSQSIMKADALSVARCCATDSSIVPLPQKPKLSSSRPMDREMRWV